MWYKYNPGPMERDAAATVDEPAPKFQEDIPLDPELCWEISQFYKQFRNRKLQEIAEWNQRKQEALQKKKPFKSIQPTAPSTFSKEFKEAFKAEFPELPAELSDSPRNIRRFIELDSSMLPDNPQYTIDTEPIRKAFALDPALAERFKNDVIPGAIQDDDTLLKIAQRGWKGSNWYKQWKDVLDGFNYSDEVEARISKLLFGIAGQRTAVDQNYKNWVRMMSRKRSGVISSGREMADLKNRGILPPMSATEVSEHNVNDALRNEHIKSPKLAAYIAPLLGLDGGAADEWMVRLFTGRNGNATDYDCDLIHGRIHHIATKMNETNWNGRSDWTPNEVQAMLWVGYKNLYADKAAKINKVIEETNSPVRANGVLMRGLKTEVTILRAPGTPRAVLENSGMYKPTGAEPDSDTIDPDGIPKDIPGFNVHPLLARNMEKLKTITDLPDVRSLFESRYDIQNGQELFDTMWNDPKNAAWKTKILRNQRAGKYEAPIEFVKDFLTNATYVKNKRRMKLSEKDWNIFKFDKNRRVDENDPSKYLIYMRTKDGAVKAFVGPDGRAAIEEALRHPENKQFQEDMIRLHHLLQMEKSTKFGNCAMDVGAVGREIARTAWELSGSPAATGKDQVLHPNPLAAPDQFPCGRVPQTHATPPHMLPGQEPVYKYRRTRPADTPPVSWPGLNQPPAIAPVPIGEPLERAAQTKR